MALLLRETVHPRTIGIDRIVRDRPDESTRPY
jgi:hypothetical protein